MHPAFSVIFLTTLLGAGQGVFLAMFTVHLYQAFNLWPAANYQQFYVAGSVIAVVLLLAGLLASFFHLGHPERAWRSAAKWRTSWLSREVIILPLTMVLITAYGLAHYMGWTQAVFIMPGGKEVDPALLTGFLAMLAVFALFVCSGMIYASIKFLREWHSPLTVINFILMGTASGFIIAAALAHWLQTNLAGFYTGWAIILTVAAFIFRFYSLGRNKRLRSITTLQTATGIKHPQLVQQTQGFMGGSFNTREFFHRKSAGFIKSIKVIFILLAFFVPIILLVLYWFNPVFMLIMLAIIIQYIGLLAERWYFFAEANHPQNHYYQKIA